MDKPYIKSMLRRLVDTINGDETNPIIESGKEEGYNSCCIELFDKMDGIGVLANVLLMEYLFGRDDPSVLHVRCPKCRTYHSPFDIDRFVDPDSEEALMKVLGHDLHLLSKTCGYIE